MSEYIDRLIARSLSDINRAVSFREGMGNFCKLIKEAIAEMDDKLKRMEEIEKRINGNSDKSKSAG